MKHKLLALLLAASVMAMNVMPALAAEVETPAEESAAMSEETGVLITTEDGFVIQDGVLIDYIGTEAEITIPNGVTRIESGFFDNSTITGVVIPEGVTYIGNSAFFGCSSLTSITIPESVKTIEGNAFSGCSSLSSITLPNTITSIEDFTFDECSSLTGITIPDTVTSIGFRAFSGCSSLSNITIPNSVTSIGNGAFWGCSSLTSITLPNTITSIGDSTFMGCSSLTSITIPDGVTSIGDFAFASCLSLTSIIIPNNVTSISQIAFGCPSLTIYGYEGSYAQKYANENEIPFQLYGEDTSDDTAQDNTSTDAASTTVSASLKDPNGVLPEGVGIAPVTSITSGTVYDNAAAAAKAKIRGLSAFAVLDIKLTDASIHELNGYVEVTIQVPGNLTVGDGKTIAVYRLEEDGTTLTRCESSVANGMITFTTNHFSTYIVANVPASPKMGETSNSMNVVYLILLMAGIGSVLVVKRRMI